MDTNIAKDLSSPQYHRRIAALDALAQTGGSESANAIMTTLLDNSPHVRRRAAEILGTLSMPEAVIALVTALDDNDPRVVATAAKSLGHTGSKEAIESLLAKLASDSREVRLVTAAALFGLGEFRWQDIVRGTPADFSALAASGDARALKALSVSAADKSKRSHLKAARALAEVGYRDAITHVGQMLEDENRSVRKLGATLLGYLPESDISYISEALSDPTTAVRGAAVDAIGKMGNSSNAVLLLPMLFDPSSSVRKRAAKSLEVLGMPSWSLMVHGNSGDFARLATYPDPVTDSGLERQAKSDNPLVRIAIVRALGASSRPEFIPAIIEILKDDDWRVRKTAIRSLSNFSEPAAVEGIRSALSDPHRSVSRSAETALDSVGKAQPQTQTAPVRHPEKPAVVRDSRPQSPMVEKLLDALFNAVHPNERVTAARHLGEKGDASRWHELATGLNDKSPAVRTEVTQALVRLGVRPAAELVKKLLNDDVPGVRLSAISAIVSLAGIGAAGPLIAIMDDPDPDVKQAVADSLEKIKAFDFLVSRLGVPQDRRFACDLLGKMGSEKAVEHILPLLVAGDGVCRMAAASALSSLGHPRWRKVISGDDRDFERIVKSGDTYAVPILSGGLSDSSPDVRRMCADALGHTASHAAVQPLLKMLAVESDDATAAAAAMALGNLKNPQALNALLSLAGSSAWLRRLGAIRALGALGNRHAVPKLLDLMRDTVSGVRSEAARALSALGDPRAVKPLIAMMFDRDDDVRATAKEALKNLATSLGPEHRSEKTEVFMALIEKDDKKKFFR